MGAFDGSQPVRGARRPTELPLSPAWCSSELQTSLQSQQRSASRPMSLTIKAPVEVEENNNVLDMPSCMPGGAAPKRNRKKRPPKTLVSKFDDVYEPTGQELGEGATGSVASYRHRATGDEYAVKMIKKHDTNGRHKVLKEIEIFHQCKGQENILQLVEFFEEEMHFHMVFEKMEGGTLLETIERRSHLSEQEASLVIKDLANAINFLHNKGIAHRDLKPENILCVKEGQLTPVKICDFDLGSGVVVNSRSCTPATTPELLTPVGSAEFMAPEVVDVWQDQAWSYDKRCDMWSLGIILYMMLCGYPPFYGQCGQDCGWEHGESCNACQSMLFDRIQDGDYDFPDDEWSVISESVKDLIQHLLVKDPHQRYTAQQVLQHPWVASESSLLPLATPRVLQRNNSVKELEAFAESANALNRMILRHTSISEAYEPPTFRLDHFADERGGRFGLGESVGHFSLERGRRGSPVFEMPGGGLMFQIGSDSDDSESSSSGEECDQPPILWMGLSPPGESSLARRRSSNKSDEEQQQQPNTREKAQPLQIPGKPRSPPKVLSSIF